jgi:hypothetical protein
LLLQRRYFKGSYSEGARDCFLPELDRAYQVNSRPDRPDTPLAYYDEGIPLYQIAYHGFLLYNSFRCAVNTFPGDDIYLTNIAYGGIPIIYYHHIFNPGWNANDGWANDFIFSRKTLKEGVAKIKRITDDFSRLAGLQTRFIDNYIRYSPTLTETVYSDGSRVFVNYSVKAYKLENGIVVPGKDFAVIEKGERGG